jgi:hypothetical protein
VPDERAEKYFLQVPKWLFLFLWKQHTHKWFSQSNYSEPPPHRKKLHEMRVKDMVACLDSALAAQAKLTNSSWDLTVFYGTVGEMDRTAPIGHNW